MSVNLDPSTWRLSTLLGIPYKLKDGTPTFSASRDGNMMVKETIIIEADNLLDFIAESVPVTEAFPGGVWAYIPARTYPGIPSLLTQSTEAKPLDTSKPADPTGIDPGAPAGTYGGFMEVDVTYSTLDATTQDEDEGEATTFLEVSADAGAEILATSIGGNALFVLTHPWHDPDTGIDYGIEDVLVPKDINNLVPRVEPRTEWSVRFPLVSNAVSDIILGIARPLLGKINIVAMPVLKGASRRTILFTSISLHESYAVDSDGVIQKQNQLEFKFNEKHIEEDGIIKGHNGFYSKETGHYEGLLIDGNAPYEDADLNQLWS